MDRLASSPHDATCRRSGARIAWLGVLMAALAGHAGAVRAATSDGPVPAAPAAPEPSPARRISPFQDTRPPLKTAPTPAPTATPTPTPTPTPTQRPTPRDPAAPAPSNGGGGHASEIAAAAAIAAIAGAAIIANRRAAAASAAQAASQAKPAPTAGNQAPAPVSVPDVVGQSVPDAQSRLAGGRLEARIDAAQTDRAFVVVAQFPRGGSLVPAGSPVTLSAKATPAKPAATPLAKAPAPPLARPPASVALKRLPTDPTAAGVRAMPPVQPPRAVPDVTRLALADARARIASAGLAPRPDAEDHADERVVEAQAPSAGTPYREPIAVALQTARWVRVPALFGLPCDQAAAALTGAGLSSRCHLEAQAIVLTTPRVFVQSVEPGTRLREGSLVTSTARAAAWPVRVAGGTGGGALLLVGALGLWRWRRVRLRWRAVPDPKALVLLRFDPADDAEADRRGARIALRAVPDAIGLPLMRYA